MGSAPIYQDAAKQFLFFFYRFLAVLPIS